MCAFKEKYLRQAGKNGFVNVLLNIMLSTQNNKLICYCCSALANIVKSIEDNGK